MSYDLNSNRLFVENIFKKNDNIIQCIKNEIIDFIKPKEYDIYRLKHIKQKLLSLMKYIINLLNFNILIIPIFVGSSERKTWIKNHHDIDLFLTFPDFISIEDMI